MPILQEEWHRQRARSSCGENKSAHFTKQNLCGGPNRQQWQAQQQGPQNNSYNNNYNPQQQAGPSNYKPAPYKKFGQRLNYQNSNQSSNTGHGPNHQHNKTNCQSKKMVKQALIEENKAVRSQSNQKTDKVKQIKAKANQCNLLPYPLLELMMISQHQY